MAVIPSVDVVIPHHGDATPTLQLVEQLLAQRRTPERVVVVDDASVEPFPEGVGYEVVRRRTNGGFAAAVNSGVATVTAEAVLVLNSDVSIAPDFVGDLLTGAEPWWPAVVSTRVRQGAADLTVSRHWPTVRHQALEWLEPLARFHGHPRLETWIGNDVNGIDAEGPVLTDWVVGVCLLLPAADVRAVGGLDERFFMNCEEIDLQLRLHTERGLPVVLLPGPELVHVGGGSSDPGSRPAWLTTSRFRYHEKWHGDQRLRWSLHGVAVVNLLWNAARNCGGRDVEPARRYRAQRELLRSAWQERGGRR